MNPWKILLLKPTFCRQNTTEQDRLGVVVAAARECLMAGSNNNNNNNPFNWNVSSSTWVCLVQRGVCSVVCAACAVLLYAQASGIATCEVSDGLVRFVSVAFFASCDQVVSFSAAALRVRFDMIWLPNASAAAPIGEGKLLIASVETTSTWGVKNWLVAS